MRQGSQPSIEGISFLMHAIDLISGCEGIAGSRKACGEAFHALSMDRKKDAGEGVESVGHKIIGGHSADRFVVARDHRDAVAARNLGQGDGGAGEALDDTEQGGFLDHAEDPIRSGSQLFLEAAWRFLVPIRIPLDVPIPHEAGAV